MFPVTGHRYVPETREIFLLSSYKMRSRVTEVMQIKTRFLQSFHKVMDVPVQVWESDGLQGGRGFQV